MPFICVDLRSDTVTRPSLAMRREIAEAEVGDDGFGDDPTVNALQEEVAALLGTEDALFMPSGTMSNSVAVATLCRGEAICEADAHIFYYELSAAACRAGVQLIPVKGDRGTLWWKDVAPMVRPGPPRFNRTGLICLENTHNRAGGTIVPLDAIADVAHGARECGIPVHLDGARLWHAAIATGTPLSAYAAYADTVSVCFSKGLGAPIGACLCGPRDALVEARMIRSTFGGRLRQVGIVAAGARYALRHNLERLADDHLRARVLAEGLANVDGLSVETPDTNIVMIDLKTPGPAAPVVEEALRERGVWVVAIGPRRLRAVTHLDVDDAGIDRAVKAFGDVMKAAGRP
jgi:threonine aldolase